MEDKKRPNQVGLLLSEVIHSNEISEKKLSVMEDRLSVMEKIQVITIIVLSLVGGGTIFAILKLLALI
ncbi:MAG: hypothetical protein RLO17_27330 [Cyclobacteriaceae bacterium]